MKALNVQKMNKEEKAFRKTYKAELKKAGGYIVTTGDSTVVFWPTCRGRAWFSLATCGAGDKFNRKYGEFVALLRYLNGERLPCAMPGDAQDAEEVAMNVCDVLGI